MISGVSNNGTFRKAHGKVSVRMQSNSQLFVWLISQSWSLIVGSSWWIGYFYRSEAFSSLDEMGIAEE